MATRMPLNVYKISQLANTKTATFDAAIVVAETEFDARRVHPRGFLRWDETQGVWHDPKRVISHGLQAWTVPRFVEVELVGLAKHGLRPGQVILTSLNP